MRLGLAIYRFFKIGWVAARLSMQKDNRSIVVSMVVPEDLILPFYLGCLDNYRRYEPGKAAIEEATAKAYSMRTIGREKN